MNRNDRVALELHRAILEHLSEEPLFVINRALRNVERKCAASSGESHDAVRTWEQLLLKRDFAAIAKHLTADDHTGRLMRSSSVFQGVLDQGERERVLETVRGAA